VSTETPPSAGVFVVTEEIYHGRKVYAVAMSLNGAKLAALKAMGLPHKVAELSWVDQEADRPAYRFQKDQGYLDMYHQGTQMPFRIEWKSVIP
jgi:predicted DNA-binding protein (MmcQ/YjbR family)